MYRKKISAAVAPELIGRVARLEKHGTDTVKVGTVTSIDGCDVNYTERSGREAYMCSMMHSIYATTVDDLMDESVELPLLRYLGGL